MPVNFHSHTMKKPIGPVLVMEAVVPITMKHHGVTRFPMGNGITAKLKEVQTLVRVTI